MDVSNIKLRDDLSEGEILKYAMLYAWLKDYKLPLTIQEYDSICDFLNSVCEFRVQ